MSYLDGFQESPFGPLGAHMAKVRECVALVEPMFQAVRDTAYDTLKDLTGRVFKVEHEADVIKTAIRQAIPKTFYLPIYGGDLLAYLKLQDDIADSVEDIAVVLTLKNLAIPEGLRDDTQAYVQKVLEVCEHLFQCTDRLAGLTERDFGGPRAQQILELVAKAEHAEWEADKAAYALSKALFALDDTMKATDIFLWSSVFRELGTLANHADKTAERLRRMLVR